MISSGDAAFAEVNPNTHESNVKKTRFQLAFFVMTPTHKVFDLMNNGVISVNTLRSASHIDQKCVTVVARSQLEAHIAA